MRIRMPHMIKGLIIVKTRTNRLCTGTGPGSARAVKGEVQVRVGGGSPRCNPSAPWLPGCRSTGLLRTCAPLPSRKTGGNTYVWIILNMLMRSASGFSTAQADCHKVKVDVSARMQYRRAMPGARVQGTRDDCDTGGMTNKDTRAAWDPLSREATETPWLCAQRVWCLLSGNSQFANSQASTKLCAAFACPRFPTVRLRKVRSYASVRGAPGQRL